MDDRKFTLVTDKLDSKYEKPSGIKFPKALYEDEYFRGISAEAKVVYCVMLDLTQEARKKRCANDRGEVYIIYTLEQIMHCVHCKKDKAIRIMAELDEEKGIGLIHREKQRIGQPNHIYVKMIRTKN